jgi:hemerythrin
MRLHLQWQTVDSVGVQSLDDDHRMLLERADALIASVKSGAGKPARGRASAGEAESRRRDVLDDLVECAVAHFEEEERLLAQLDWPGLPAHREAHDTLLRTLLKFKADLRYGRLTPDEAAEFIADWVLAHIRDEDMQYRDYLHARGVR